MQEKYLSYAAYIDKIVQNQIQAKKYEKIFKKHLIFHHSSFIFIIAVTLIALKREVATYSNVGFPRSECQVRKLTASHCTTNKSSI